MLPPTARHIEPPTIRARLPQNIALERCSVTAAAAVAGSRDACSDVLRPAGPARHALLDVELLVALVAISDGGLVRVSGARTPGSRRGRFQDVCGRSRRDC